MFADCDDTNSQQHPYVICMEEKQLLEAAVNSLWLESLDSSLDMSYYIKSGLQRTATRRDGQKWEVYSYDWLGCMSQKFTGELLTATSNWKN